MTTRRKLTAQERIDLSAVEQEHARATTQPGQLLAVCGLEPGIERPDVREAHVVGAFRSGKVRRFDQRGPHYDAFRSVRSTGIRYRRTE